MPPTDADCEALYFERINARHAGAPIPKPSERWKESADLMVWREWIIRSGEDMRRELMGAPTPLKHLKPMLENMDYNNVDDRGELVAALEHPVVPWFPVGTDHQGELYRLLPGAYGLLADKDDPQTDRELVSDNVLGVNTNVQPRLPTRSRQANLSEESTQLNESDDMEIGGFVFHQVGRLEFCLEEIGTVSNQEEASAAEWRATGFCVVVRFGRSGAANGVYMIYDFWPEDLLAPDDPRGDRIEDDMCWGSLRGWNGQFSVAKIADKISDLRWGYQFQRYIDEHPNEVCKHPIELVRAAETTSSGLIRLTVAK